MKDKSYIYDKSCYPINKAVAEKSGHMDYYNQDVSHIGSLLKVNVKSKDSVGYAEKARIKKKRSLLFQLMIFSLNIKLKRSIF